MKENFIQFWKSVDSISGNSAAIGVQALDGTYIVAYWVIDDINFMTKETVAAYITQRNMRKNSITYQGILNLLDRQILRFVNSGVLTDYRITAPSFDQLPAAKGDQIIIPGAYEVTYVNALHTVQVQGTLYIAA
jgi:hypothetical protein